RSELRQVTSQEPDLVHLRERLRHPAPHPADVEEQIAHGRRSLERAVDQVERVLHGALEVERQLAALAMEVPEDLHEPRRLGAQRAGVAVDEMELPVE